MQLCDDRTGVCQSMCEMPLKQFADFVLVKLFLFWIKKKIIVNWYFFKKIAVIMQLQIKSHDAVFAKHTFDLLVYR